jgi:hypothetical protein
MEFLRDKPSHRNMVAPDAKKPVYDNVMAAINKLAKFTLPHTRALC